MKISIFMFALSVTILPSIASCETKAANSMNGILKVFEQVQGETLGIFDIDMVLKQPVEPAFQMPNMKIHKVILKELLAPLTSIEKNLTLNLITKSSSSILIESQTPQIIAEIQKITPQVIALTASLTGRLEDITDVTIQRYDILKTLGFDFSTSFPETQPLVFHTIKPYRGNYPEFKNGILSSNGETDHATKGHLLVEFLKATNYTPKSIIFIDDREKNIKDVESALTLYNSKIHYIGILYKGAENFPSMEIDESSFEKAWLEKIKLAKEIARKMPKKEAI